jgi:hypothetical protein
MAPQYPLEGGCPCLTIRYRMETAPMIIHCCHCTWCQRESGASYALNAMIERSRLTLLSPTAPTKFAVPTVNGSGEGKDQLMFRCPNCMIAVWSQYPGLGERICVVRVGTLDKAREVSPDAHIWTGSKQAWVVIPQGVPQEETYYDRREKYWTRESLERRDVVDGVIRKGEGEEEEAVET